MSSQGCKTFTDALDGEGIAIYTFGTWVLHYAPIVVTVAAYTDKWKQTSVISHILMATALFCIYSLFQNPVVTYGCATLDESIPILATCGYATVLIIVYTIYADFNKMF